MKKTITVKLDDREIEVRKLPIGEYAELIKAIKKLPKHIQTIDNLGVEKILEILPDIIGDGLPDLLGVVSVATKLPMEEVEKLGLDEIVKLVEALYEVNNYQEVYKIIKKALARRNAVKPKKVSKT